jgi:hypothetical protein
MGISLFKNKPALPCLSAGKPDRQGILINDLSSLAEPFDFMVNPKIKNT